MSIILGILFAAIVITVAILRPRLARKPVTQVLVRRYVHPGHGWIRMNEDGDVLVGMDDFAQSVIGSIDTVLLPRMLKRVEQGGVAWEVVHGGRTLRMVSPVTGRVIEKNEMVLNNPSLINNSPYGDGWLFKVRPTKLSPQLHNLLTGKTVAEWQETVRARLSSFFSVATPALMYQDGGVMVPNLSERCSDEEWNGLTKEFFLTEA
jgi:glycine cleavage system H protein